MTKRTQQWLERVRMPLAAAIAAGLASPASAFQFNIGEWDAAFDTDLSAAVGWRVESRDDDLVGKGNGGNGSSTNFDDGNLNFDSGDTFSERLSGTSELFVDRRFSHDLLTRAGGLVRAKYWFDFKLKQDNFRRDGRKTISPDGRDDASGGDLLDAYVWTDWNIADVPVSLRYGRQVFNWGESTFIPGGINSAMPVDVAEIRSPGSEVRDALLPIEAFYASAGLTRNLTVEGYVQFDWNKTEIDDCGTFFSTSDFVNDGCGPVFGLGGIPETENLENFNEAILRREADKRPDADDQFGLGLQYFSPTLANTEFGLYFVRYHSRLPLVSGTVVDPDNGQNFPTFFVEFPEDIKLYGASFNTTLPGGWAWSGEYSFKEDVPLQFNSFELINGGLKEPFSKVFQQATGGTDPNSPEAKALEGEDVNGFDRLDVSQAQMTFIQFFDRTLGSSRLTVIGEVGATFIHDLPSRDEARFGRSGVFGQGAFDPIEGDGTTCADVNINSNNCTNEGFVDDFSWGYSLQAQLRYDNFVRGWNFLPSAAFSHGVNGNGPEPGAAFREEQKSATVGFTFSRQREMSASVEFVSFFGGDYNTIEDRDHVNASVSYSF